jgi:hypothetical protein
MLQASLHARKVELQIKITHIANPDYTDPFHIVAFNATGGGEFRLFVDYHQLQQIANAINEYVTANPNETNHAHAS